MNIESIIETFNSDGIITAELIAEIENNRSFCADLVIYFRQNKHRQFVLALLDELIRIRRESGLLGDHLMLACYLLGLHNQVEDCLKVWEAKRVDFDSYCYIDNQLLPFAGVEETISYLKTQTSDEAIAALKYVEECKEAGDFDILDEYFPLNGMPWFV